MWQGILQGLEGSGVAAFIRQSIWAYPAVEILHISGFVMLVGSAFVFDLRLIGRLRSLPITDAVHHLTRWARRSFALVVPSGFLLFMVDATTLATNPAFQIKLLLIGCAAINAAFFHWVTFRKAAEWDSGATLPGAARLAGVVSIVLWFSVIAFGRLIAYV